MAKPPLVSHYYKPQIAKSQNSEPGLLGKVRWHPYNSIGRLLTAKDRIGFAQDLENVWLFMLEDLRMADGSQIPHLPGEECLRGLRTTAIKHIISKFPKAKISFKNSAVTLKY